MHARRLTPILNVSDIQQSFSWFEKLGWEKAWAWGTPPDFGGVCSWATTDEDVERSLAAMVRAARTVGAQVR